MADTYKYKIHNVLNLHPYSLKNVQLEVRLELADLYVT